MSIYEDTVAFADETIAVSSTAVGVTVATARNAERMFITTEDAQIRYRYSGSDPTSSVGHLLEVGDVAIICGPQNILQFRAIRVSGDAEIFVTYEK